MCVCVGRGGGFLSLTTGERLDLSGSVVYLLSVCCLLDVMHGTVVVVFVCPLVIAAAPLGRLCACASLKTKSWNF